MKLARFLVLPLGLMLGFASANGEEPDYSDFTGTVWANGLFENENGEIEGWYDINKENNQDGTADDNRCYAASAVNLIAWWQTGEYGKNLTSSAPKDINQIWSTYVGAVESAGKEMWEEGGESLSAINWWISGVYYPDLDNADELARYYEKSSVLGPQSELPITLPDMKGYYYDDYGLTQQDLADFLESGVWSSGEAFELNFAELLQDDIGITLSIDSDNPMTGGHAVTLWGANYENGELVSLWLTDSDDYDVEGHGRDPFLFEVKVELMEGENGDVEKILFEDYYGNSGEYKYYIQSVHVMDASASASWRLVPEPTTTTLSLLTLAGLAARRRRK